MYMNPIQLPQDPVPLRRVTVYVPRDVAFNLDKMNEVTKKVLGRLGCDSCHSGRLIDFLIMEDFVVNSQLEVQDLLPSGRI
jgi:hypothetical protein